MSRRRHANEFLRTSTGRLAGSGILHDDYSEESGGPYYGTGTVMVRFPEKSEEEKKEGPVVVYNPSRYERIKYMTIEQMAKTIIDHTLTDEYCKSDCDSWEYECPHELECCIKWLNEK